MVTVSGFGAQWGAKPALWAVCNNRYLGAECRFEHRAACDRESGPREPIKPGAYPCCRRQGCRARSAGIGPLGQLAAVEARRLPALRLRARSARTLAFGVHVSEQISRSCPGL